MSLHSEAPDRGNRHRQRMLEEVQALIGRRRREANRRRRNYFRPDYSSIDHYRASCRGYRDALRTMLGWPLTEAPPIRRPTASSSQVAEDDLGRIFRLSIETLPDVHTYGLFFRPPGDGPFPLVIAQHGGGGTPERIAGFFDSANYNDMLRRVLRRGIAVFAPQLLLWKPELFGPDHEKNLIDRQLKHLGGSLAALECLRIQRSIDHLVGRRDIDATRIGMIGLSYGGFYTLYSAALDERIRVAVSSCFFNDRTVYDFPDWVWFDAANRMLDAEIGALVCPRPLYIEVGLQDHLFKVRHARATARRLAAHYRRLGIEKAFRYVEHAGGHELDRDDAGIEFLCRGLAA